MLPIRRTALTGFALLTACAACTSPEEGPDARPVSTRMDSAGIEIVVSEPAPGGAPAFALLDSVPSLRLGSLDGPEEEQFGSIPALVPLPDGGVAVLDQQAVQVRIFGADGTYLGARGSRGEGPGAQRVTLLPLAGGSARMISLEMGGTSFPTAASFFSDGRMVGAGRWFSGSGLQLPGEGEEAVALDSALVTLFSARGELVDTVTVIPSMESVQKWERSEIP